jgi:hypothetical protein
MHQIKTNSGTRFFYNHDLSGEIIIEPSEGKVSGGDLLEFVAEYIRQQRIRELENASVMSLLGLDNGGAK